MLNIRETIGMPESKTLEFKEDISSYEKIVKTIIAFANGIAFDCLPCYGASIDDLDIVYIREQFPNKKHNDEQLLKTLKIRNPMIVRIFKELNLVEQLGSGIPRIFGQITDFGLSTPKMEETSGRVRTTVEVENVGVNEMQEKIILLLKNDIKITQKQIAEKLNVNEKTIERNIKKLKHLEFIERIGSDKSGE